MDSDPAAVFRGARRNRRALLRVRGRVVGLFNMAMLGLRAGSGLTVGLLGTIVGVRLSLAVSSLAVVLVSVGLLVREGRARARLTPETEVT